MEDRIVKKPVRIIYDVLVRVENFIFPANFIILDCEVDFNVQIILGRSFLAIGRALVNMKICQLKFTLNDEEVIFNVRQSMKLPDDLKLSL